MRYRRVQVEVDAEELKEVHTIVDRDGLAIVGLKGDYLVTYDDESQNVFSKEIFLKDFKELGEAKGSE